MRFLKLNAVFCLLALASTFGWCQRPSMTVDVSHPGAKISPSLYGIFFEEINHAGDGGLYAELIRNRNFEEKTTLGWSLETSGTARASMALDTAKPQNEANRTSLRVEIARDKDGTVAVINEGYWGIALLKGYKYELSFYARANGFNGTIEARLQGPDGKVYGSQTITGIGSDWKRYTASFESTGTEPKARLALVASAPGTIWFDTVSLFPAKTWKGRPNGMRTDIAQMLADLKPAFLRFPGGCYVEGGDYLRNAFRWKTTVSDIASRPGHPNEMWAYYSTDGLGYHEYLQLAEDLGAEPLFDVNAGISHREVESLDRMEPWVQDALDAIEYANGPVTSKWGALRAKNGHPEPFNLKYIEIGNENGGPNYEARYPLLYKAIKEKYPNITLIATNLVKKSPMDIVDNHIYSSPEEMRDVTKTYDNWDRKKKPLVFVGEYAVNNGVGAGNLKAALAEAGYMIGFERNADVVKMASYAPLFFHVNDRRWPVNLIGYDSSHVFGMPSYWVQQLFANNRGSVALPVSLQVEKEKKTIPAERGAITLTASEVPAEFKDVRITNGSQVLYTSNFAKDSAGWRTSNGNWKTEDGVFKQTSLQWRASASIGNNDWQDYSLSLKLRKMADFGYVGLTIRSGARGFGGGAMLTLGGADDDVLASLDVQTADGNRSLGSVPGTLEIGRWYDVRIDVTGTRAQVSIDGKPVIDVANFYREMTLPNMEAGASLDEASGEIILKVVNYTEQPQAASIKLQGASKIEPQGTEIVLTSASLDDTNSIEQPRKVAPVTNEASGFGPEFTRAFAPRSLTILRLKTAKTVEVK